MALRPAISDLFAGYGIAGEDAAKLLRKAVEFLVLHCERTVDPRRAFLNRLEEACRAYVTAQGAEEGKDDGAP